MRVIWGIRRFRKVCQGLYKYMKVYEVYGDLFKKHLGDGDGDVTVVVMVAAARGVGAARM